MALVCVAQRDGDGVEASSLPPYSGIGDLAVSVNRGAWRYIAAATYREEFLAVGTTRALHTHSSCSSGTQPAAMMIATIATTIISSTNETSGPAESS